jgi:signal peptidase II
MRSVSDSRRSSAVSFGSNQTSALLSRYAAVAAFAAIMDGLSKFLVVRAFGVGGGFTLSERLSIFVTFNQGSAGGIMVGPYTWHLNVLLTALALVLITGIVRQLAAVDARAAVALGLVAGGAIGNMCSMIWGPPGVADFFAIQLTPDSTMIMNVADLALWSGALMLLPVVGRLVKAIRAERQPNGAALASR